MNVLELVPGRGWYTRILGPALAEKGKLFVAIRTGRVEQLIAEDPEAYASTQIIALEPGAMTRPEGTRRFTLPEFAFGIRGLDLALTFRNMHNFTAEGRRQINDAVFRALRRGGHYGIVDHTRRHMQPDTDEVWRRIDPVQVIKEVTAAGFDFIDYADLHHRPDDELRFEVGRRTVSGNTDRFTLLFKKP